MKNQIAPLAALLTLSAACALLPATAKDDLEPVAADAGFKPAEQASRLFTVAEAQALKGVKRVVVPLFTVDFTTADSVTAQTSGFGSAGRASASAYYKLKGVSQTDFQALTESLYAGFLAELKAAGIDSVPADKLLASPHYRKMVASGKPAPALRDDGMMLAPAGMAIYGVSQLTSGGNKPGLFGGLAAMTNAFSAVGSALDADALQKELDAAVLEVQVRVHFVQLTNGNKGFFGRLASTASVGAQVFPSITSATFTVHNGTRGTLTLKQPLMLDPAAFAEVRKAPTTAGDVAGAVAVGLLRLAVGSRDSSSSEEMEAVADPAKYREVLIGGIGILNQMFVQRLRAGE